MKKALLSLAVIAASGAYVVYENHAPQQPMQQDAAATLSVQPQTPAAPASSKVSMLPEPAGPATIAPPAAFVITMPSTGPVPAELPATPPVAVSSVATAASTASNNVFPARLVTAAEPNDATVPEPAVPLPRPRPNYAAVAVRPAAAQVVAQASSAYRNGTFQGLSANAYYGRVEVDAIIQGGQLVKVDILNYPSDRRTSRNINSRAMPELQQEAIQAQSANIDSVSGATLSSEAFIQSLDSALQRAHGGGNA